MSESSSVISSLSDPGAISLCLLCVLFRVGVPSVTRQVLEGHTNEVWYISFSHDGKYLASTSVDYRVIIWDLEVNILLRSKKHLPRL